MTPPGPYPPDTTFNESIELEPLGLDVVVPNQQPPPPPIFSVTQVRDDGNPLPDRPGLHCPNCDYDVRGLVGRTCPECGGDFRKAEARLAGLAHDPGARADYVAIRVAEWKRTLGYTLMLVMSLAVGLAGLHPAIIFSFVMATAITGVMVSACFQLTFESGVFVTGLMYAAITGLLIFLSI